MGAQLDLTKDVVNVKWGGGIFVTGFYGYDFSSSKIYTNKKNKWNVTFSAPVNSSSFGVLASFPGGIAYASVGADKENKIKGKPIFVLGGTTTKDGGPAMMLTSSNGIDWSSQTFGAKGFIYLVTWNETDQALYAGMVDIVEPDDAQVTLYDVTLKSADGKTWTQSGRILQDRRPDQPAPVAQYCSDKILDRNGNRVPTSVFGYDKNKDILIAPDPINMTYGISYPSGEPIHHGERLKIKRGPNNPDPGERTVSLPAGMELVWAVAFAGGVWQAAGQGIVATSTDEGQTWKTTLSEEPRAGYTSVAGGATSDQPPAT
jgi:hypothetical protein